MAKASRQKKPATPTRRTPRQARAQATVDCVLAAAAQVFRDVGFDAANTNLIAEVAGVSVGSLYQYFPDKRAIGQALCAQIDSELLWVLNDKAQHVSDLRSAVQAFVKAAVDVHSRQPELVRVLLSTPGLADRQRGALLSLPLVEAALGAFGSALALSDKKTTAWVVVQAVTSVLMHNHLGPALSPAALQSVCERLVWGYLTADAPTTSGVRRASVDGL